MIDTQFPMVRLARGSARWLLGLDGEARRVFTAWSADLDGGQFPNNTDPVAEADAGGFGVGEDPDVATDSVVPAIDQYGNVTLFPLAAFDNPNFTLDGGVY